MLAKDINYPKLDEMLNNYAIDKLYDILEKNGAHASEEIIEELEKKIITNKIIIVDYPNPKDDEFFNHKIPIAHGGRTKNDGFIHIYPYIRCKDYNNIEELYEFIIQSGIITHELFHYFIHLDDDLLDDEELKEFSHFINEGMVQAFTEEHENKMFPNIEYRKNIQLANKLRNIIPKEYSTKTIYRNTYTNICKKYPEAYEVFKDYKKLITFLNSFKDILKELEKKLDINHLDLYNRYNKYSVEETVQLFKEQVDNFIENKEENEYFKNSIENIYQEFCSSQEKKL